MRKTHVRAQKPREVVQEVYAWLLGHWSVRVLIFQAATTAGVPPLRLSFTGTLRVIRRAIPRVSTLTARRIPRQLLQVGTAAQRTGSPFFDWLTVEILDTFLPERIHRNNPRVVKKPVSKFRSKKLQHRGTGQRVEAPKFHITSQPSSLN